MRLNITHFNNKNDAKIYLEEKGFSHKDNHYEDIYGRKVYLKKHKLSNSITKYVLVTA